jgi:lycopene cyclase domain-containing protein
MGSLTYINWLTIFVWLPLAILWMTNFRVMWKYKRTIGFCVFCALVFSVPWDLWAIYTKIWIFPADTNMGLWFAGLPLEEYLFIIFVTILLSTITLILREKTKHLQAKKE